MKKSFGDGYAIKETENGKWCIIKFDANVGDTGDVEKLTDEQIDEMDIDLYETEVEARSAFNKIILAASMNAFKNE